MRFPITILALVAGAVIALPSAAGAATGSTTIDLSGPAAKSLRQAGVTMSARRPATLRRSRLSLPLASSTTSALTHSGGLVLKAGRRSLRLTGLRLGLGARPMLSAQAGKRRVSLLSAGSAGPAIDQGTGAVSLTQTDLRFTAAGGRLVRSALKLRRVPSGALGRVRTSGTVAGTPGAPNATAPSGSGGGGPGGTGGGPGAPGGPGTTTAPPPISEEPPVLARPANAADVVSAEITWSPRESFVRYMASGEGSSTSGGATSGPPRGSPPLVYDFFYPFTRGWAVPGTDTAAIYGTGTVTFSYRERGIDLDSKDPEIELNGAASRAIFRFDGRGSTQPGNKRAVMVDLDPSRAESHTISPDGKTHTWTRIPGTIPQGSAQQSVFAGFYAPGDEFGSISVTYTIG